jgi:hypothetical protein
MSRLPGFIKESLAAIVAKDSKTDEVVGAIAGLLDAERRLEGLSRAVEAFREAMRSLGILDESRSGQRVYDAWSKISRFFLAPLLGGNVILTGKSGEYEEVPPGYEDLGARWERTLPEVEAFLAEERLLDRSFAEAPVSSHVGFKLRSRLLLLDRRAERIKIALDLVRRDVTSAAREGVDRLASELGVRLKHGARGGTPDA